MIKLDGYFVKILFHNEQNYYTVALFKVKNIDNKHAHYANKIITINGQMPGINLNQHYQVNGQFIDHAKYGKQLNVSSITMIQPTDHEGVVAFLSSPLFKGIGKNIATKVVEHLGSDALKLIIENVGVLDDIDITDKQKSQIAETLTAHAHSQEYIVKLTNLGFKMETAFLIYNNYHLKTNDIVNDLYLVCLKIPEVSFKEIDHIVKKNNLSYDQSTYQQSVILEYIKMNTLESIHTIVYMEQIYQRFENIFDENTILTILKVLKKQHLICIINNVVWLENLYQAELDIASFFNNKSPLDNPKVDNLFPKNHLHAEQKNAIIASFKNKNAIITGGPGTGKTMIIKHLIEVYQKLHPKISYDDLIILAPTGKAAKRVTETANYPASTIHRFLKWNKELDTFDVNINQKAPAKMVIIDEASMVDTMLLASLIRGLENDVKLILVGDYHQLPSIRAGQPLKDLIDSQLINTTYLTHVFRHDAGSSINLLGQAIIDEDYQSIENASNNVTIFYNQLEPTKIRDYILKEIEIVKNLDDFTILIPMYRGLNGIDNINNMISEKLHFNQAEYEYGDAKYRVHDKVLLTTNLPDLNIFNGDIGYIADIDYKTKEIFITFDDILFDFKFSALKDFKLGYAISIHKSQGSEYQKVIIILDPSHANMLDCQLLYTAITRAKKELHIIGDLNLLMNAIKHKPRIERNTYLKQMMYNK